MPVNCRANWQTLHEAARNTQFCPRLATHISTIHAVLGRRSIDGWLAKIEITFNYLRQAGGVR